VSTDINFCVRCGHAVEPREAYGAMRPVCPQCGRVHFIDPKVAVGVVIERAGKLLLIRRANDPERDKWSFPAGFVDGGEDPARAAAREAREETGLTVRLTGLLDVVARASEIEGADFVIVYRAEVVAGVPTPGDDASEVRFFGPDEVPELAAFASTHKIIDLWQAERAHPGD
jgi:ADP-ribose pyrophosphatase YjhB (NUDIX family)